VFILKDVRDRRASVLASASARELTETLPSSRTLWPAVAQDWCNRAASGQPPKTSHFMPFRDESERAG
jgi:hypothetical protein